MRACRWCCLAALTSWVVSTSVSSASAQAPTAAPTSAAGDRLRHAWGRCKPDSWKLVRVRTETLDENGQISGASTTETLTTLEGVSDHDFTLHVEVFVEIAGKQFNAQPQTVKQGFFGETDHHKSTVRKVGDGGVTINGRLIPCETREVVIQGEESKRTSLIHYSDKISPYTLKRETTVADATGRTTLAQSLSEVLTLDMPFKVREETKNASWVKTIQKHAKGSAITLEVHCDDVPGGVVFHTSREDDEKGRTVRRSTLELIDYGPGPAPDDPGASNRRRLLHRARTRTPPAGSSSRK